MTLLDKWYRLGNGDLHIRILKPPSFTIQLHFGIALVRLEVAISIVWFEMSYNWERRY